MRGWELVEYAWDPNTGIATLTYERTLVDTGEVVTKVVTEEQLDWYTPGTKMKI